MTNSDILDLCIVTIILILIALFPGYVKDWGQGEENPWKPHPKDSPQYLQTRFITLVVLGIIFFLMADYVLRKMGSLVLSDFLNYIDKSSDVHEGTTLFSILSVISCYWIIWYGFKDKKYEVPKNIKFVFSLFALIFIMTYVLIRLSVVTYWFCVIANSAFLFMKFSGLFEKLVMKKYRKKHNAEKDGEESVKDKKDSL